MDAGDIIGWSVALGLPIGGIVAGVLMPVLLMRESRLRQEGRLDRARSGSGGGLIGGLDEVFHPHAHNARLIREVETELPAPAPIPGDRPDLESGRIAIRLPGAGAIR